MTSVFDISAFEANGWVFRLCNDKVLGTPPPGSPPDALATLRPHREAIRKALFGRGGVTVLSATSTTTPASSSTATIPT